VTSRDEAFWLVEFYFRVHLGGVPQTKNPFGNWITQFGGPNLNSDPSLWRIKPKPREWIVYVGSSGLYFKEQHGIRAKEKIKVREVIE